MELYFWVHHDKVRRFTNIFGKIEFTEFAKINSVVRYRTYGI